MGCSASVPAGSPQQNNNSAPQKQQLKPQPKQVAPPQPKQVAPPQPKQAAPPQPKQSVPLQPKQAAPLPKKEAPPPPKEPTPPPPKEPTPPPPKEPTPPPPKEPTPPPPKEPTPPPPKEPTPPPPKEPTPPPPKEPTPPPPKEPTPQSQEDQTPPIKEIQQEQNDDSKLSPEVLQQFIDFEKDIQKLQRMKNEEKQMLYVLEFKHTQENVKSKEMELQQSKSITLKEYQEFANFNVQSFMITHNISYLSQEQADAAKSKEEQEYLEAKNKEDICEKELNLLKLQLGKIQEKLDHTKSQVETLCAIQDKQDGLLENLFNGDYGSELEEKLELESEELLQKKQKISSTYMTWVSSKKLVTTACSQMVYSINRWKQISQHPTVSNIGKFIMCTETRNQMISAHMNIRRAAYLLKLHLPYWTPEDDKNMVISINLLYNDVTSSKTFHRALAWYKYYHWRFALLLNWMEQVINTRISEDSKNIDKEFREKYQLLKMERLRCIKEIVKEKLGIDLDIEQFREDVKEEVDSSDEENKTNDENKADMLEMTNGKEGDNDLANAEDLPDALEQESDPTSLDAIQKDQQSESNTEDSKKHKEGEENKMETEDQPGEGSEKPAGDVKAEVDEQPKAAEENKEKDDAPKIQAIPLDELAPLPSTEELFGKVEQLMGDVEKGEEALEKNKWRQEQELQERLRKRKSRRRKIQDMADKSNVEKPKEEEKPSSGEKPEEEKPKEDQPKQEDSQQQQQQESPKESQE